MQKEEKHICPKCGERNMVRSGKIRGKVRWVCENGSSKDNRVRCYQTVDPTTYRPHIAPKAPEKPIVFAQEKKRETLVITWAQNATPIHEGFFAALQAYCKKNKAQLLVVAGRYKNPTSQWTASQENAQWWASEVKPFLVNTRFNLNENLVLLGDIKTQPTAVTPLTGFESITHGESGILGHPKLQMTVVPTPSHRLPKILTTTGAVTVANYTDSKAGKKGEFHHVYGAIVVELDGAGKLFHLRHLNAREDGAFCDLDQAYYPDGRVVLAGQYAGLVFGDTHVAFTDTAVDQATFGQGGLVERLNPKTLVFHDLLDSYAVNPHHLNRPFIAAAKRHQRLDNLAAEVENACRWVSERATGRQARIIASNHNDFFARWMDRCDWRDDPENAAFYLETALHMVKSAKVETTGASIADPFQYWAEQFFNDESHILCVRRDESLVISGIECSLHGDQGPNGSRGSRSSLSKIGAKTIIGHSHTPGITNGCYQTGTSTPLRLEYTGSVGSWLNSHVSIDPMGKRHIHTMVGDRFWVDRKQMRKAS